MKPLSAAKETKMNEEILSKNVLFKGLSKEEIHDALLALQARELLYKKTLPSFWPEVKPTKWDWSWREA